MDDRILLNIDSEQADLIIRALQEFRKIYYERARFDNETNTPRVQQNLNTINQLEYHLKQKMNHYQYEMPKM